MRKLSKLLLLLPFALSLSLAGCKKTPTKPSEPDVPVEPEEATFPVKDVISFYDALGVDVVVPAYEVASEDKSFEVDDSLEGYFDVYVNNTTGEELVAYKEALKEEGWVVTSTDEETSEDFILQYGETIAFVSLLNYISYVEEGEAPYNLVSFYTYEETPVDPEPYAFTTKEVAATLVASSFNMEPTEETIAQLLEYGWLEEIQEGVWFAGCANYWNLDDPTYLTQVLSYYVSAMLPEVLELTLFSESKLVEDETQGDYGVCYLASPDASIIVQVIDYINSSSQIHIEFLVAPAEYFLA